jgi:hypothetical protein
MEAIEEKEEKFISSLGKDLNLRTLKTKQQCLYGGLRWIY